MFHSHLPRYRRLAGVTRRLTPVGLLSLLFVAACSDEPVAPPPAGGGPAASVSATQPEVDATIEQPTMDRFTIDVSASGSYRPGVPVQIHVRTTAHLASPETQLRVVVPELAMGEVLSGARADRSVRRGVKPRDTWTANIRGGGTDHHVAHIVFPGPGVYHVSAEASHPIESGNAVVNGRFVLHGASELIEVEVTDRGVRATKDDGAVEIMLIEPCETQIYPTDECEPPPPPDDDPPPSYVQWVWTAVWYSGPQMSTYEPVRRARVNYSGSGVPTGSAVTDEGGYVQLPCNGTYGGNTNITVTLDNPDLRMTATWTSVSTTISMGSLCYGGGWVAWYNWSEGRTWDNLQKMITGTQNYFGYKRGWVKARVGGKDSCSGNSCWLNGSNEILIHPDHVWGPWGEFVQSHEFGHAYHAGSPYGLRVCAGAHGWGDTRQDGCLALDEGFATYAAFMARGPGAHQPYYDDHERDWRRSTCPGVGNCETRVTAFLMDLSDPINASDLDGFADNIQLPSRHVFDMIGQCSLRFQLYDYEWNYVVSDWTQYQRGGLSEVYDCLRKVYPLHKGTMYYPPTGRMVDIQLVNIAHPWSALTGTTMSNVTSRYTRG